MPYRNFPTHLGGDWANHDWIDLKPEELAWAAAGSLVKGEAVAILAYEQAAAALEFGINQEYLAYTAIANVMSSAPYPKS